MSERHYGHVEKVCRHEVWTCWEGSVNIEGEVV